jgi:putative Holliday junction resolvase
MVHLQDERRTTDIAHERMARTGLTHKQKKARRDAIAAAAILQAFLEGGAGAP